MPMKNWSYTPVLWLKSRGAIDVIDHKAYLCLTFILTKVSSWLPKQEIMEQMIWWTAKDIKEADIYLSKVIQRKRSGNKSHGRLQRLSKADIYSRKVIPLVFCTKGLGTNHMVGHKGYRRLTFILAKLFCLGISDKINHKESKTDFCPAKVILLFPSTKSLRISDNISHK